MPFAKSSVRLGIRRHFGKSGVSARQKIVVPRVAEVFRRDTDRSDMAVEFESRLDRRQAAAFLTARGYRTAPATLAKLACIGGGPTFESFGRKPYIARQTCSRGRGEKRRGRGGQQAIREAGCPAENGSAGSPGAALLPPGMFELALAIWRPSVRSANQRRVGEYASRWAGLSRRDRRASLRPPSACTPGR